MIRPGSWATFTTQSSSNDQPFVWRPGLGRTNLQNPFYPFEAHAYGINNQGQIVGQAGEPIQCLVIMDACYWSNPAAAPVRLSTTSWSLVNSCAYGINESGQVAGEGQFEAIRILHPSTLPGGRQTIPRQRT